MPGGEHLFDPRRDFNFVCFHGRHGLSHTERVPHLERPQLVREAPAHGSIHVDDLVRDLGYAASGVSQRVVDSVPRQRARLVVLRQHECKSLAERLDLHRFVDGGNVRFTPRAIFHRLEIE